jgi:hypothetical protein
MHGPLHDSMTRILGADSSIRGIMGLFRIKNLSRNNPMISKELGWFEITRLFRKECEFRSNPVISK